MRLSFDISDDSWKVLSRTLRHGNRKHIYKAIIEGFAKRLEEEPERTLALVMTDQWDLREYVNVLEHPREREDVL